jgi:hypothetical protein
MLLKFTHNVKEKSVRIEFTGYRNINRYLYKIYNAYLSDLASSDKSFKLLRTDRNKYGNIYIIEPRDGDKGAIVIDIGKLGYDNDVNGIININNVNIENVKLILMSMLDVFLNTSLMVEEEERNRVKYKATMDFEIPF